MKYFKIVVDNYIVAISKGGAGEEISENEYDALKTAIHDRPMPPDGYDYKLRASDLEWELVELPPEPQDEDITDEEALDIILGGADA